MIQLDKDDLVPLFMLLANHENELDMTLMKLKGRIERDLYTYMSIEDLEGLLRGEEIDTHDRREGYEHG